MKKLIMFVATGVLLGNSGISSARYDEVAAKRMAIKVCAPCHGETGVSLVQKYPNLAGQKKMYLARQMTAFKKGTRKDPIMMEPVAQKLSRKEIKNMATYYSKLDAGWAAKNALSPASAGKAPAAK